jgi:hypothetical protein
MNGTQRLPVDMQTFSELRGKNCLYIDKTAHLVNMIENGKIYFLSRPRRFGKSLAVSTLKSLFLGQKNFFDGLAAQSWLSRKEFSPRPVISLSLFGVSASEGLDVMEGDLITMIRSVAGDYDIQLAEHKSRNMFYELVDKLEKLYNNQVAILIDEYDHPITEFIDDPKTANLARGKLQHFYSVLKDKDEKISFVFITGVTKFAKNGLFSALNNLKDISLHPEFATLCGFTQQEIENDCFKYVKEVAVANSMTADETLAKMDSYYNGYSFDGKQLVYNPYAVLNLFDTKKFRNYWFTSASPTHLEKYLAKRSILPSDYIETEVKQSHIDTPKEIENCDPAVFLYQAGYMTLRESKDPENFILVTPNEEVTESMLRLTADNLFATEDENAVKKKNAVTGFFQSGDVQKIMQEFNGILSLCGYDTYASLAANPASYECYNRDIIAAFLSGTCDILVSREVFGAVGRADIVAKLPKGYVQKVYIFELKMLQEGKKPEEVVQEAKNQILNRRYAEQHFFTTDTVTAVALAIDKTEHNIAIYDTMELKKYEVLEKPLHISEISSSE